MKIKYITKLCNIKVTHDTITYEQFYKDFKNNKTLDKLNMKNIKIQKFYVRALFQSGKVTNTENVKNIFNYRFNIPLILNNG